MVSSLLKQRVDLQHSRVALSSQHFRSRHFNTRPTPFLNHLSFQRKTSTGSGADEGLPELAPARFHKKCKGKNIQVRWYGGHSVVPYYVAPLCDVCVLKLDLMYSLPLRTLAASAHKQLRCRASDALHCAKISGDGTIATRTASYNMGVVMSEAPLRVVNGEKTFQLKMTRHGENDWAGSLAVGIVVVKDPDNSSTQVRYS